MDNIKKLLVITLAFSLIFSNSLISNTYADTINDNKKLELTKANITLQIGESYKLAVKNYQINIKVNVKNKNVKFSSNKKRVATVSAKGKVTAKSVGTALIIATASNGMKAVCKVDVTNKKPVIIDIPETGVSSSTEEILSTTEVLEDKNIIEQVYNLVNEERAKEDIAPFELSEELSKAADERAKELIKSFSHIRPNGLICFSILSEYDIDWSYVGENIAYGAKTAEYVVDLWINSEGHKKNILNSSFNRIGIGHYIDECTGTNYWVQLFAD